MGAAVGDVVELVCPDGTAGQLRCEFLRQPAREFYVVVRVLVWPGGDFDELGAVEAQRVLLFLALGIWNDDDGPEAQGVGDHRKAYAGVARRALDDRAARLQQAFFHRVADDEQRGPVLDRLSRIEEFRLAPDVAARCVRDPVETDQRRVANGGQDVGMLGH